MKNGCTNKPIPKMNFVRHKQALGSLEAAKEPKFGKKEGQKYKIVNFEAKFPFGTL